MQQYVQCSMRAGVEPRLGLGRFKYSFICQGTSTRRQRRDLFGLRIKPVPTGLTTQR